MTTDQPISRVIHLQSDPYRALAARLATAPGLVRAGAARWDDSRTPIHPLALESAYADPALLRDLGDRGARFARDLGVDVVVGAETAGVPLAAAVSLAGGLPFAFVRKPGYRGHEADEPPVRGAGGARRRPGAGRPAGPRRRRRRPPRAAGRRRDRERRLRRALHRCTGVRGRR